MGGRGIGEGKEWGRDRNMGESLTTINQERIREGDA